MNDTRDYSKNYNWEAQNVKADGLEAVNDVNAWGDVNSWADVNADEDVNAWANVHAEEDVEAEDELIGDSVLIGGVLHAYAGAQATSTDIDGEKATAEVWSLYLSTTGKVFKKVADSDPSTDWEEILSDLRVAELSLTSAQIKALNTTPQAIVSAPWVGKAIMVEKVVSSLTYATSAYETNTDLEIRYDGSTAWDATGAEATVDSLDAILLKTASAIFVTPGLGTALDAEITQNKGITAKVATWDPATWGWTLKIKVFYRIATL